MQETKLANYSIIFIGLILIVFILETFQSFLRPFIFAIIFMFLFIPITRYTKEKKIRLAFITFAIVLVMVIGVSVIGALVIEETTEADEVIPDSEKRIGNTISDLIQYTKVNLFGYTIDVGHIVEPDKISTFTAKALARVAQGIVNLFSELFLVLLFLLFLLPSHNTIVNRISKGLDPSRRKSFRIALTQIENSIRTYLYTKTIISLGTAFVSAIVMWLFGVKFVVIFAILIFALNFIPNIGSFIAVGAVLISHFLTDGYGSGLIILSILLILIQILFGNIIEPKYAGRELELSPIVIILSLFFWGSIWGIGGMLFAVPLMSVIKIVLQNIKSTKAAVEYIS